MESVKGVRITALTSKGQEGINKIKDECAKAIVKVSLKRLKTTITFNDHEVMITNPCMDYCPDLNHAKSIAGISEIKKAYSELGAIENKDYKIEVMK